MRTLAPARTALAERYEALRAYALGERSLELVPLGLSLLRHQGLAAWMATEGKALTSMAATSSADNSAASSKAGPSLPGSCSELARLLAGAAISAAKGVVP